MPVPCPSTALFRSNIFRFFNGLAITLLLTLVNPASVDAFQQQSQSVDQSEIPASIAKWEKDIAKLEALDATESNVKHGILFCGSSSIRLWKNIADDMAPWVTLKRGYGGAKLTDLNHYVNRLVGPHLGEANPRRCRAIVCFVANDIVGNGKDPQPAEVVGRFQRLLQQIRNQDASVPFFWIEVTPTPSRWKAWSQVTEATQGIRDILDKDPNAHFIPTAGAYMNQEGQPDPTMFVKDKLHLNETGYQRWASLIKARLYQVLGPATLSQPKLSQPKSPLAPPIGTGNLQPPRNPNANSSSQLKKFLLKAVRTPST